MPLVTYGEAEDYGPLIGTRWVWRQANPDNIACLQVVDVTDDMALMVTIDSPANFRSEWVPLEILVGPHRSFSAFEFVGDANNWPREWSWLRDVTLPETQIRDYWVASYSRGTVQLRPFTMWDWSTNRPMANLGSMQRDIPLSLGFQDTFQPIAEQIVRNIATGHNRRALHLLFEGAGGGDSAAESGTGESVAVAAPAAPDAEPVAQEVHEVQGRFERLY